MSTVDGEQADAGAWASGTGPPTRTDASTITLVEGSSFCISDSSGDMQRDHAHGLFVADTRVLSCWRLAIDGEPVETLSALEDAAEPYRATFVGRTAPRRWLADSTMLVVRNRFVGDGLREDVVLRNLGPEPVGLTLTIGVDADFADLFAVKVGRARPARGVLVEVGSASMSFTLPGTTGTTDTRGALVTATGEPAVSPGQFTFQVVVPARSSWSTCLAMEASLSGRRIPPLHRCGEPVHASRSATRMREWRLSNPRVSSPDRGLVTAIEASARDLGALRIEDPEHPDCPVVAAGAPWFMALFGRDSLLTAWMSLALDPRLALCTLRTLARMQGTQVNPLTEEEPGRIPHEIRLGREAALALGGGNIYYGTTDATPLFVMLLGELDRWGGIPDADRAGLLAAADRALAWVEHFGDADQDGFVEYRRYTDRGLANQGWKDSFDGINHRDGRLAAPPIALCEVQAYVYAAFLARAELADTDGDTRTATHCRRRAGDLKEAFNRRFWMPGPGAVAVALDGAKQQVDSITSNMAHCLWCGILDADKAAAVAALLAGRTLNSGFGLRTLATDMGAYNPMSYHNGSVWPHDTAIAVAGLMRYGFISQAQDLALGLLDAATHLGGRLPELFCGFDRDEFDLPIPYPTSCSPQAWAAAAPRLVLRSLLRLQPDLPRHEVRLAPAVPERLLPLRLENVPLAGARMEITVRSDGYEASGLPTSAALVRPGQLDMPKSG
ncbi:MAG TPA: glycogen debranching N-terminal domain-containing protein [Pseudonocardia sp.]|uniref:amylo-alpha-1,6-glucosidase n=1 Tax=Pseudonocardia sp. TaxID=60912 RepID=UPI002CF324D3|nr:glycogen debranching N-terminal domain-containing protein [Pseudonocardia sp.]HTF55555.1 glycogen debranching N-terminal domain-containing protein [Pseudonocardia sp.]